MSIDREGALKCLQRMYELVRHLDKTTAELKDQVKHTREAIEQLRLFDEESVVSQAKPAPTDDDSGVDLRTTAEKKKHASKKV